MCSAENCRTVNPRNICFFQFPMEVYPLRSIKGIGLLSFLGGLFLSISGLSMTHASVKVFGEHHKIVPQCFISSSSSLSFVRIILHPFRLLTIRGDASLPCQKWGVPIHTTSFTEGSTGTSCFLTLSGLSGKLLVLLVT